MRFCFDHARRALMIVTSTVVVIAVAAPAAQAGLLDHRLKPGARGPDVKALQVRIAGWYPTTKQRLFRIDGIYGRQTKKAMRAFEAGYGRPVNGIASRKDLRILNRLQVAMVRPSTSTTVNSFRTVPLHALRARMPTPEPSAEVCRGGE